LHIVVIEAQDDANWREDMCAIENVDNAVAADGLAVPIGIVKPLIAGLKDKSEKNWQTVFSLFFLNHWTFM
jgi:hypothetical protein